MCMINPINNYNKMIKKTEKYNTICALQTILKHLIYIIFSRKIRECNKIETTDRIYQFNALFKIVIYRIVL